MFKFGDKVKIGKDGPYIIEYISNDGKRADIKNIKTGKRLDSANTLRFEFANVLPDNALLMPKEIVEAIDNLVFEIEFGETAIDKAKQNLIRHIALFIKA